ncbi:TIGR04372 family glycosyltransferase [Alphaproteobacteria bacterium]|nr:TIGR04372 family glycosyltransferase [Alphaproteobacteria bacterium]
MRERAFNKMIKFVLLLPALFIVLAQRTLSPVILIRTSSMDTSRIGWFHILNWHLRAKVETKSLDLFFEKRSLPQPASQIFLKMWTNQVRAVPFRFLWEVVHRVNQALPSDKYTLDLPKSFPFSDNQFVRNFQASEPLFFSLNDVELLEAKRQIKQMSVSNDFICFHNRDSAFLDANLPENNWSYHDHRDSNIQLYAPAIKYLADSGINCIRLGTVVRDALEPEFQKSVIDYQGTKKQSALLDLYLASHCKFFITTDSGVNILPYMFNRPVVLLNWINLVNIFRYMPKTVFIPKMYRSLDTAEYFDFYDMLYGPVRNIARKKQLDAQNAEIIENSPDEILHAVREMQLRLSGRWHESKEDKLRQKKFWNLFGQTACRHDSFHLSARFLKKYENLLDRSYEKYVKYEK